MHEFIIVQTGPRSWTVAQRHTQFNSNTVYEAITKPFPNLIEADAARRELENTGDIEKCSKGLQKMFRTVS